MEKTSPKEKGISREFSAGGAVFKRVKEYKSKRVEVLWLVAKSTPSELYPKGFWRLPKGWLDDEEDGKSPGSMARGERKASEEELQKSALREVAEEGGIEARIIKKIGTERYFFTLYGRKILKFVTFYLMEWQKDLPQGPGLETSEIAWLLFEEARGKLKNSGERKILDKAMENLNSGIQENFLLLQEP